MESSSPEYACGGRNMLGIGFLVRVLLKDLALLTSCSCFPLYAKALGLVGFGCGICRTGSHTPWAGSLCVWGVEGVDSLELSRLYW